MTLSHALKLIQQRDTSGQRRSLFLACGIEPLHLRTFLRGHFAERFPAEAAATIQTGLFGDVPGSVRAAGDSPSDAAVVVLEWSDFDPRLGLRTSGA